MCYGMGCTYEDWYGECQKPRRVRCPADDPEGAAEDVERLEWALDDYYEMEMERRKEARDV